MSIKMKPANNYTFIKTSYPCKNKDGDPFICGSVYEDWGQERLIRVVAFKREDFIKMSNSSGYVHNDKIFAYYEDEYPGSEQQVR